jgi:hypothetical protein
MYTGKEPVLIQFAEFVCWFPSFFFFRLLVFSFLNNVFNLNFIFIGVVLIFFCSQHKSLLRKIFIYEQEVDDDDDFYFASHLLCQIIYLLCAKRGTLCTYILPFSGVV